MDEMNKIQPVPNLLLQSEGQLHGPRPNPFGAKKDMVRWNEARSKMAFLNCSTPIEVSKWYLRRIDVWKCLECKKARTYF